MKKNKNKPDKKPDAMDLVIKLLNSLRYRKHIDGIDLADAFLWGAARLMIPFEPGELAKGISPSIFLIERLGSYMSKMEKESLKRKSRT